MKRKILILQARNFGDAIITTKLINTIGKNFPDFEISVFTRNIYKNIYQNNPYIKKLIFANFPMGTQKNFSFFEGIRLLKQVYKYRSKYDIVINNIGDVRENFLGFLLKPKKNIAPFFEMNHPFRKEIRNGLYKFVDAIYIPNHIINIYDIQWYLAKGLGCKKEEEAKIFLDDEYNPSSDIIGIHPITTQKTKNWKIEYWKNLIKILSYEYKKKIWIFGAPSEKKLLYSNFKDILNKNTEIKTDDIKTFFKNLQQCRLLVGLDSFAIHAANALSVPNIMINGSHNWNIWKPPNTIVISKGEFSCMDFPCSDKPTCMGTKHELICLSSISVEEVLMKIDQILNKSKAINH